MSHTEKESKGVFYISHGDQEVANMTYSKAGSTLIIIDHTEVDGSLRGSGAGLAMVVEAVEWARKNKFKIMPLCPFAASVFKKQPQFADVLS